ncbi:MAG: hypothetical protein WCH30_05870 [Chlorobiaceae bacterium]
MMKSMTMRCRASLMGGDAVLRERFLLLLQRQWKICITVSALWLSALLCLTTTSTAGV